MPDPRSRYRFDERTGRYRDARTGRFVAGRVITGALEEAIDQSARQARARTQALREGTVSLAQWQTEMMAELKMVHLNSYALARGGWAQMSQSDYGRVGQIVRREYGFLRARAEKIASGEQLLDGTLLQISEQYIKSGRATYLEAQRREAGKHGWDEERSVRHAADSCEGCIREEQRGWVPLGQLVLPGRRECHHNCKCDLALRNSLTGEERAH